MSITSIVSSAAGNLFGGGDTDPFGQQRHNTDLKDFLAKFSDSSGKHINQINPLNTFEVSFLFQPLPNDLKPEGSKSALEKVGDLAVSTGIGAAKSVVNNLTGGLLGAINNDKEAVQKAHDKFDRSKGETFMSYLASANLLVGDENTWFGAAGQSPKPLILQLGYYIQSITIPQLKIPDGGKSTTLFGEFPINGTFVIPDSSQLQMEVLNTRLPLIDRLFYPWMREVTSPFWVYDSQPYTTATIMVDFSKHTDLCYVFSGCRPSQLQMIQPSQTNETSLKRQVTFIFDYMFVLSKMTTMDSTTDRLLGAGGTLFNAASNVLNLG